MIDLLVERAEFGHGGNQEVIRPMAALSDIEVLLITPQMQSFEAGSKIQSNADVQLEEIDVPNWDNEKSKKYLQKAEKNLFEQGLTSINDAGVNPKERELFIELFKNNDLTIKKNIKSRSQK